MLVDAVVTGVVEAAALVAVEVEGLGEELAALLVDTELSGVVESVLDGELGA